MNLSLRKCFFNGVYGMAVFTEQTVFFCFVLLY